MWVPVKAFPRLNNIDLLQAAVEDAVEILQNPPTETFAGILPSTNQSQLIEFFNTIQQQPRVDAKHTNANKPHAQPLGVPTQGAPPTGPRRSQRLMTGVSASAINPDTGKAAEYRELRTSRAGPRWELAMSKELGRLFQGYMCAKDSEHSVQGTQTCTFITCQQIPTNIKATYVRIVANYREHKADPYWIRCTVGGD